MIKFSNPVPGSRIQESQFSKTVELFSFPNDSVISPYNGIIVSYDPNNCGGKMKIKHVVNNNTYFSEFCNLISNTSFFSGVQVREGQTIGQLGSNNLEYTIKNSNGDKQNVKDFLSGVDSNKEKKEKEENKLETKTSEDKGYGALGDALLKGMLFPFGMVSSTMEKNKKKDEIGRKEKEDLKNQVSEEIKRIKELLK
jgi:hypothetical protein